MAFKDKATVISGEECPRFSIGARFGNRSLVEVTKRTI